MNLKDSYLHGTDQTALIRALKWNEGVLKYQSASTSTDWISIGTIPTWNQDTTGTAQYATYLTNGTNNLTYSNLSGISGKTINSGTANYAAYYSGTNTISAEQYLSTSRGGTGKGTWTQYGIVIGGVSNTLSQIAVPTWNANTTYWLKCNTNSSKVPTYSLSTIGKSDIGLGNVENKSSATIRGEITSKNVTDALGYTPYNSTNPNGYTTNTGTVTSISTGVGLTGGDITTTGIIKTKLKVENLTADDSTTPTYNKNRLYPVVVDKSGNLAVVVPWTNVNSSYQTTISDLTTIRSNASYGKQAYDTLGLANTDVDGVINRWEEVKDLLKNIAQGSDLASTLAKFVTLDTAQTITGSKTFSQAINADILGTATQANRWSNTHNFTIKDSDNINSGTATAIDGSTDYVLHLPSTIKANITGNISGSAGSVAWTNVSGRPTNVSSFTNDSGYITSSANITGTAAGITGYTIKTATSQTHSGYSSNDVDNKILTTQGMLTYWNGAYNDSGDSNITKVGTISKGVWQGTAIADTYIASAATWNAKVSNVTSHLRVGATGATSNTTTNTSDPFLSLVEGSTQDSQVQLKAGNGITITAKDGIVTIVNSKPDVNHNTDTKVKWSTNADDANKYLAFSPSSPTSGTAYEAYYNTGLYFNPKTKLLKVEGLIEVDSATFGNLVIQGTSSLGTITGGTWNASTIAADYLPLGGTDSGTKRWVKKDNTTGQLYIDQRNDIQTLPIGNKTYLTYIGAQSISNSNKSNAATTNGNTYMKIFEDNTLKNQYKISGSGSIRVASDSNGNITITGNTSNEAIPFTATNYSLSSASWTSATSLTSYSGTFAIQIKDSGTKTNYYSGIIMINGNDGRTAVEEIPLSALMATGSDTEVPTRIYAGIQQGILKLSSQDSQITEHSITVKILKLIAL